jgi:hypothetical protein
MEDNMDPKSKQEVVEETEEFVKHTSSAGGNTTTPESVKNVTVDDPPLTYKQIAKLNGINYTVTDVPPLGTSMLLGLQHYLTMLGATVLIPLILCPAMGANGLQTAEVISSIFFISGINTVSARDQEEIKG